MIILLILIGVADCGRFAINTKGCTIPDFDPFNSYVNKYLHEDVDMLPCNNGRPPLIESNFSSIYIINKSLRFYDVVVIDDLVCGYTPFRRIPPKYNGDIDKNFEYSSTVYFYPDTPQIHVNDEFIKVECFYQQKSIYVDFFAFVPLKNSYTIQDDGFNVLLMGFDGTSRLNFHRHWTKTKKVFEQLGVEELFGYNKVADASFANQMPLLAGVTIEELNQLCWVNYTSYFDDCTFIWDVFKKNGYVTAYGDDTFAHGLFHGGHWVGFKREHQTDYLFDYFMAEAESKIGNNKFGYFYDCLGSRETYKVFLNYIEKFLKRVNKYKFFGNFFETIMSHDSIFKPKISDPTIADFFNSKLMKETLKNTILIIYSDHGARFGAFRSFTFQGLIEDMLPYISFYFPMSFKEKYKEFYENFKINRRRLTTPFDVHETLLNLLDLSRINKHSKYYSLFQEIPKNRTCEDAKIPLEYCACGYERDRTTSETFNSFKSASLIVSTINRIIPEDKCVKLRFNKLLTTRTKFVNPSTHYTVVLETLPNKGIFQGTVKLLKKFGMSSFELIGDITRLNRYGNQSLCVENDIKLKLYCYCY